MKEIILVRSLAESDLGLFEAHRASARSKQRAININSPMAEKLLSPELFAAGDAELKCICVFGDEQNSTLRRLKKTHKNWRLGGNKIKGGLFAKLDSKDFMLIRSVVPNGGEHPVTITFISRNTQQVVHAGLAAILEKSLRGSMACFEDSSDRFEAIASYCPSHGSLVRTEVSSETAQRSGGSRKLKSFGPMPRDNSGSSPTKPRTIKQKIETPQILERMLKASSDLSAPSQLRFFETVEGLASQLRQVLLETGGITKLVKNHKRLWSEASGKKVGFIDGGMANLSMLGSAPIATRVGGYTVVPGQRGDERESFQFLKLLIDELYDAPGGGVYDNSFPDIGALRDAARITIEAAGAVQILTEHTDITRVLVHGALVNPVSRYTDIMRDEAVRHPFPDFSDKAVQHFLPATDLGRGERCRNFINVYLQQLKVLQDSKAIVCGVIEREATTTSVIRATLNDLDDEVVRDLLPVPPAQWKEWFRRAVDPSDDEEFEGQRITDSLLFRCVLEPGEALRPVGINRNELRRAPKAWHTEIDQYPMPRVSYVQVTEWTPPVRLEMFEKDISSFDETADFVFHCCALLPGYAFPAGLDIADKFAKIPNWMSRPINTNMAVTTLRRALDQNDKRLFDSIRHILCGTGRDFLLRPGVYR